MITDPIGLHSCPITIAFNGYYISTSASGKDELIADKMNRAVIGYSSGQDLLKLPTCF